MSMDILIVFRTSMGVDSIYVKQLVDGIVVLFV